MRNPDTEIKIWRNKTKEVIFTKKYSLGIFYITKLEPGFCDNVPYSEDELDSALEWLDKN